MQSLLFQQPSQFFLIDDQSVADVFISESNEDICVQKLDCNMAKTTVSFMQLTFEKFSFPSYFGHNWSAFIDSFTDYICDNVTLKKYILFFSEADELYSDEETGVSKEEVEKLFDCLQNYICSSMSDSDDLVIKIVFVVKNVNENHLLPELKSGNFNFCVDAL